MWSSGQRGFRQGFAVGVAISHLLRTREGGTLLIQADGQVRQEASG